MGSDTTFCQKVVSDPIFFLIIALAVLPVAVSAADLDPSDEPEVTRVGDIQIVDPWARSSIGGAHEAKLFFEFRNWGPESDRLIGARAPIATGETHFIAVDAERDERILRRIESIEIPAGGAPFELSEVGFFVELTGLQTPVLMGTRFPVELIFEQAGSVTVDFVARFHSPKLNRRIREAAKRGDVEALKALRPPADLNP